MTHKNPDNENTGTEAIAEATEAASGSADAAAGSIAIAEEAAGQKRVRRTGKPSPLQACADLTPETLDQAEAKLNEGSTGSKSKAIPAASKLERLVALLRTPEGATLPELASATRWQVHSVRGAMAGALRKKGHTVVSEKPEGGVRRYRIAVTS